MLCKTRGIVLHTQAYNDAYNIIHIYAEELGKAAFMNPAGKGGKQKTNRKLFLPLSLHDMEIEWTDNRDIHRIRETRLSPPLHNIYSNPVKNAITLFLAEFIWRLIKESAPDRPLFSWLFNSISLLESADRGTANFHIACLINLLPYAGLQPQASTYRAGSRFDMRNGIFVPQPPPHSDWLDIRESHALVSLLRINYNNMSLYAFSRNERTLILSKIINYYRLHLPHIPELKSLPILQTLFAE
ncbi:MAG: DNA repair protein RecO [Tannerellaceae bacterium]|jgi:DNA repair protein RecO (recombination protein O)|nr:DNA repair protein RecO [Tannerellaceae bacterium]